MMTEVLLSRGLPQGKVRKLAVVLAATLLLLAAMLVLGAKPAFASGTVTVSVAGKGDATGPGIVCNESAGPDCSESYPNQRECEFFPQLNQQICFFVPQTIELTAGADRSGYAFDGWTGCDTVATRTCGLTVESDRALTARFRDAEAPSVSSIAPGSGLQRGTIMLGASASDNSGTVGRVEFRVRGALVATDTTAPYSASFNTASVADGSSEVQATAFDAVGLSSSVASSVTIDNTAPTVNVTGGPSGQTFGPGSTQTWTFSTGDATSGVASVQCSVVATGSAASFGPCSGGSGSHSVAGLAGGDYTFSVRVWDNGGLEATQNRAFRIDATPPDTSITSGVANGALTKLTSLTWAFSSSETGSRFECSLDGAAFAPCSSPKAYSGLASKTHTFRVRAVDAVGHRDGTPATRTWKVDAVLPTVSGMSPRNASATTDVTPTIRAIVRDNLTNLQKANVKLYVNGVQISPTKWSYNASTDALVYNSPRIAKGKKTVRVVATDAAKNVRSTSWYFTIR